MSKHQANTPIRPQLLTEQIVEADESTEEGGVQAEIGEIDGLWARVGQLPGACRERSRTDAYGQGS